MFKNRPMARFWLVPGALLFFARTHPESAALHIPGTRVSLGWPFSPSSALQSGPAGRVFAPASTTASDEPIGTAPASAARAPDAPEPRADSEL